MSESEEAENKPLMPSTLLKPAKNSRREGLRESGWTEKTGGWWEGAAGSRRGRLGFNQVTLSVSGLSVCGGDVFSKGKKQTKSKKNARFPLLMRLQQACWTQWVRGRHVHDSDERVWLHAVGLAGEYALAHTQE